MSLNLEQRVLQLETDLRVLRQRANELEAFIQGMKLGANEVVRAMPQNTLDNIVQQVPESLRGLLLDFIAKAKVSEPYTRPTPKEQVH